MPIISRFWIASSLLLLAMTVASPIYAQSVDEVASAAAESDKGSGLPLPRFASLKSDNVYVRMGPSMDYPIKWIYKKEGLPVEIIQEFDSWRKIKDPDGGEGWAHKILLSGKKTARILSVGLKKQPLPMMMTIWIPLRLSSRLGWLFLSKNVKSLSAVSNLHHMRDGLRKNIFGVFTALIFLINLNESGGCFLTSCPAL